MYSNKELLLQLIKESQIAFNEKEVNELITQLQFARDGDSEAMLEIALFFKKLEKNDGYLFWLQSSSSKGNAHAQYLLANCYIDGEIMEEDYDEAFKLYKKAAEAGHPDAANNLADMYFNGESVEQDEDEAIKWFTFAAENGVPEAMFTLGIIYEQGIGVDINEDLAMQYYLKSAENGYAEAQNYIGTIYLEGLLEKEQNIPQAIKWFEKAADNLHIDALFNLAYIYENGIDVKRNCKKAMWYYKKAALLGDLQSKINIARIYEKGIDVPKDLVKAKKWRIRAEQQMKSMQY